MGRRKRSSAYVLPVETNIESPRPQFAAPRATVTACDEETGGARIPIDPRVHAFNEQNTALAVAIVQQCISRK